MLWLAVRQISSRRTATALAGLGLLTATLGFITLVGTSQTTRAVLRGGIARTWNTPYDLLVRPAGSVTPLEARQGLVRPNYVSGLAGGGITRHQLQAIRHISGVAIAAPVAIAGAVNWTTGGFGVLLDRKPTHGPLAVYRLVIDSTADAGLSRATVERHYIVVAAEGTVRYVEGTRDATLSLRGHTIDCRYPVSCFAPVECDHGQCGPPTDPPNHGVEILQPIVIAGVDPAAETAMLGLDRCVTRGRALLASDHLAGAANRDPPGTRIPVLVSTRSFVDETFTGHLTRAADAAPLLRGAPPQTLASWRQVREIRSSADAMYRAYLPKVGDEVDEWPIWSIGDVSYRERPGGLHLEAVTRPADPSIYERRNTSSAIPLRVTTPPAARDRWFRTVTQHGYDQAEGNRYWAVVGTYDPDCLPGFDPLAGGGLETYAAPTVRLADGRDLRPSRSLAGYINPPPLLLTTLEGAAWLSDPHRFDGRPGAAFISVIRVKLTGLGEPGPLAEARIGRVAADIRDATGLQVDVVKGASPRQVLVDLPAGRFGRPALTVREPWSVKGAALRFTQAVTAQNLALFTLALVGATILVGETAYTAVRRRRAEFGVLRALGWPARRVAALVELEMLLLGLAVGVAALVLGLPLAAVAGVRLLVWTIVAAVPLSVAVAAVAALPPALAAARGTTLGVLTVGNRQRVRRSRPPRFSFTLGLRDLVGLWRTEALLGAIAITLGAGMLGAVVLVAAGFRGQLDTTVLGVYLGERVRPFHVAVAALTLAIGALAAGQIVTLGYLERQAQLAALQALGWPRAHVLRINAAQGLVLGALGGLTGTLAVWAVGAATGASPGATALGAVAGLLGALMAAALAVLGPLLQAFHSRPADLLRGE